MFLRLWWKSRRLPGYRRHWAERLGFAIPRIRGAIWVHAVSVGEVRAAAALIEALIKKYPSKPVLITTTTPTGRETVMQLFAGRAECVYLPYDLPGAVARFVDRVNPQVAIFIEVELWPNMLACLAARKVPVCLVNARLSGRSFNGYKKLGGLMRGAVAKVAHIAARTDTDRQRFLELGVSPKKISVTGNLKCDAGLPEDFAIKNLELRTRIGAKRLAWIAASTHPGEEVQILDAHKKLLTGNPETLLVLVPRHPERTRELVALCSDADLQVQQYSDNHPVAAPCQVLIVDRIGVLVYLYGIAPVAFIGGSLVDRGGHNPVEAILSASAVVSGPHNENFADIYAQLGSAGGAEQVTSSGELAVVVRRLLNVSDLRKQQTRNASGVIEKSQGALDKTLMILVRVMEAHQPE